MLPGERGGRRGARAGRALPATPASPSTRTAAGCWPTPIELCRDLHDVLAYAEDPVGAEGGFSGREVMAEFRRATGLPTATNMIATDWRQMAHAIRAERRRHPAGRPALLDHARLGPRRPALRRLRADLGLALQQPLRHLAGDVHPRRRRRARATITALDTHWIWQDGQRAHPRRRCRSRTARSPCRPRPGLGVELDRDALAAAHELYLEHGLGARDDAVAMQYLVPGWQFDPKRPCLVR